MKKTLALAALLAACGSNKTITAGTTGSSAAAQECQATDAAKLVSVTAEITSDTHWTSDKVYRLESHVFVRNNAVLTIDAGTSIIGASGSSLVVSAGSKLQAVGTASSPIVFSSCRTVGERRPGDWGGVVMLGRAPINIVDTNGTPTTENVEGFDPSENRVNYGGSDTAHDCGTLHYARIEYAGFAIAPDKEINGLTLAGCGSATSVDYVQVHLGKDDGVEVFGGTVNLRHILVSQSDDDGLDWDFGWQGKVQYLIVQQNPAFGDNGIEADNNVNGNDFLPRSQPTIYNFSLVGSNKTKGTGIAQQAMVLRRGTAAHFYNGIISSFSDFSVDVRDASTVAQANAGELTINNTLFFGGASQMNWADATDNDAGFDEAAYFATPALDNLLSTDPLLVAPFNLTAPDFKVTVASPARIVANAAVPPADGFFDVGATYLGAVGDVDWTAGWTAFPTN